MENVKRAWSRNLNASMHHRNFGAILPCNPVPRGGLPETPLPFCAHRSSMSRFKLPEVTLSQCLCVLRACLSMQLDEQEPLSIENEIGVLRSLKEAALEVMSGFDQTLEVTDVRNSGVKLSSHVGAHFNFVICSFSGEIDFGVVEAARTKTHEKGRCSSL